MTQVIRDQRRSSIRVRVLVQSPFRFRVSMSDTSIYEHNLPRRNVIFLKNENLKRTTIKLIKTRIRIFSSRRTLGLESGFDFPTSLRTSARKSDW